MSLILDALKRSRQDASSVPGVDTYHSLEDLTPPWRRYLPWLALGVALLLIAWLLLDRADQPGVGESAPVAAAAPQSVDKPKPVNKPQPASKPQPAAARTVTPAPAAPAQPRPTPAPAAAPAPALQPAQDAAADARPSAQSEQQAAVAALYRDRQQQASAPASRPAAAQSPAPQQSAPKSQPAQVPAKSQPVAKPAPVKEQPVDIEQMLQAARTEMDRADLAEHPAPFINSLSQQSKNAIPTIMYQRHDYSGKAGQARVVMNGKTLRVGGSPAAGVRVEEILPNSAVLSFRNTQFRLKALNSWVNL